MTFKNLFIVFVCLMFLSCQKDDDNDLTNDLSEVNGTLKFDWDEKEKEFFSLDNAISITRSTTTNLFHPIVVKTFNSLAEENERQNIARDIIDHVGIPIWKEAQVVKNVANEEYITLIPFHKPNFTKTTGVLIVHSLKGILTFTGVQRNHILRKNGNVIAKKELADIFIAFDHKIYDQTDALINDAKCFYEEKNQLGVETLDPVFSDPCIWKIIEVCSDDDTQITWVVNEQPTPIHLDHDQDGILNNNDQDWLELSARFNITQEEFTAYVVHWWEQNLEQEWGEYDDFYVEYFPWDDYPDGDISWDHDLFDNINDLINDLDLVLDLWWYWFNGGDPNEDRDNDGYPDGECPFYGGGIKASNNTSSTRNIRCDFYYVLDCGDGITGTWSDYFTQVVSCPDCENYDDDIVRQKILDLWTASYINHMDLEDFAILVADCDPSGLHFDECVSTTYNLHLNNLVSELILENRIDPSYYNIIIDLLGDAEYCLVPLEMTTEFNNCVGMKLLDDALLRQYPDLVIDADTKAKLAELGYIHHITEVYSYLNGVTQYDFAEISYILWACAHHKNDLDYYLDKHLNFAGTDVPFIAQQVPDISILSVNVPNTPPTSLTKLAETPYRDGHEYIPAEGIIPEDLQFGTNGDEGLVFTSITTDPLTILDETEEDLLDIFYDLITSNALNATLQDVAYEYHTRWEEKLGGDYYNQELSTFVLNNEHMKQTAIDFGEYLNDELKANGVSMLLVDWSDFGEQYRVQFPEITTGLGILINDTEQLQVFDMGDFQYDAATKEWTGSFYFVVYDNFGLDNADLIDFQGIPIYGKGFQAWWILQHLKGYKPFRTEIRHVVKLKGKITN